MSDLLTLSLRCLALSAGGFLLYRFADPVCRFLGRMPDYWEKEGVVRNGWSKVWREDNPERFSFFVGSARFGALFAWLWFKAAGLMLFCAAVVTFFKGLSK